MIYKENKKKLKNVHSCRFSLFKSRNIKNYIKVLAQEFVFSEKILLIQIVHNFGPSVHFLLIIKIATPLNVNDASCKLNKQTMSKVRRQHFNNW